MNNLDPLFFDYVSDAPRLTYFQPGDNRLRQLLIRALEKTLGRGRLESIYHDLKGKPFDITTFFGDALNASGITVEHKGLRPSQIQPNGPLIFLANHPFGIVDGLILCELAARLCGNLRIMINSVLCQDEDLAPYFLPVDFEDTKRAIKTNIRSKQLALEALSNNIPLLIFPSGMVSTANKMGFGKVKDGTWTTFAAKLVMQSKASVLPVYFHGQNSRKFHIASHIAEPLRMGLLMHEAINKFGQPVSISIGEPIPWLKLAQYQGRRSLTDELYGCVQNLRYAN